MIEPEKMERIFFFGQLGIGALLLAAFLIFRPRPPESGFRVREADRKDAPWKKGPALQTEARRPLALPGIRTDGSPHEILGVRQGASPETIQRAYRELMKRYHPDKAARPGTPEWNEAQKIAEAINRAKDALLKKRT